MKIEKWFYKRHLTNFSESVYIKAEAFVFWGDFQRIESSIHDV